METIDLWVHEKNPIVENWESWVYYCLSMPNLWVRCKIGTLLSKPHMKPSIKVTNPLASPPTNLSWWDDNITFLQQGYSLPFIHISFHLFYAYMDLHELFSETYVMYFMKENHSKIKKKYFWKSYSLIWVP